MRTPLGYFAFYAHTSASSFFGKCTVVNIGLTFRGTRHVRQTSVCRRSLDKLKLTRTFDNTTFDLIRRVT